MKSTTWATAARLVALAPIVNAVPATSEVISIVDPLSTAVTLAASEEMLIAAVSQAVTSATVATAPV